MKFMASTLLTLLISPSILAQSSLEGFSSGRYEVRSSKKAHRNPASDQVDQLVTDSDGIKVRTLTPAELEVEKKREEAKAAAVIQPSAPVVTTSKSVVKSVEISQEVQKTIVEQKPPEPSSEVEEPDLRTQAESIFSAEKSEQIHSFYREQIHPDDIRNNKVEIDFAPTLVYNDSQSNYSYRDYQSYFNALKVKANVWFTPLIGVSGQILFSLAADVAANDGSSSRVGTKYDFIDLGVNFRKFFGLSRKSNSLEMSVLLSDNKTNTASESTSRAKLKTQGVGFGLKARMPSSASYSWVIGGSFFPRLQHSESANATVIESGDSKENTRLGLEVGGEIKFVRQSQLIWNLGVSSERNVFDGPANLPDPNNGATPSNVSATNTFYMFSLGYRWGH